MHISQVKKHIAKPGSIGNQGHFFTTYDHQAKEGTTIEDLLNYQYWRDEAHRFSPCNKVEVITEDMKFRALLLVESSEKRVGAKMCVLEYTELADLQRSDKPVPDMTSEYVVKWMGASKWSVLRASDNTYIYKNGNSKQDAEIALKSHLNAVAA